MISSIDLNLPFSSRYLIIFSAVAVVSAAILKGSHKEGLYRGIKGDIIGAVYRCLMIGDNVSRLGTCYVFCECLLLFI